MLAFVRGAEVGGVNGEESNALVGEYQERRAALRNPLDVHEFTETLASQLAGTARDVLIGYLDRNTQPVGQTDRWIGAGQARAAAVLGFARGVEASYYNRYGQIEQDPWGNPKAIDNEEKYALKDEFNARRSEIGGADLAEFRRILDSGNGLSREAAEAIRSWW